MAKLIPAAERIVRARNLIQFFRKSPVSLEWVRMTLSTLRSKGTCSVSCTCTTVKFIPQTRESCHALTEEVRKIYEEIDQANREILLDRRRDMQVHSSDCQASSGGVEDLRKIYEEIENANREILF